MAHSIREWMTLRPYRNASTDLIIEEVKTLRDQCVMDLTSTIKAKKKHTDVDKLLYSAISLAGSMDPTTGLDKTQKRTLVQKYIERSYPYWINISADDPVKSVEMLLGELGATMSHYEEEIKATYAMVSSCITLKQLDAICASTQKIISYCIYYIHVKRCPYRGKDGTIQYKNSKFMPCVNLSQWVRKYKLTVD